MRTARKRFGQHFLEPAWVDKVIRAIEPHATDTFLEIGPGRGALTRPLARAATRVIAFEIDRDLVSDLRATAPPNLTLIEGDFLTITAARIKQELSSSGVDPPDVRVAGNLPYNVASPILFRLIELYRDRLPLRDATLMLQREVVDRIAAAPRTRHYGVPSVLIRHSADVDRLLALPPGAFRPPPKVHSALLRVRFHPDRPPTRDRQRFAALTQAIFTRRRKTVANALLAYPPAARLSIPALLARAGVQGQRRPETLDVEDLIRLCDALADFESS